VYIIIQPTNLLEGGNKMKKRSSFIFVVIFLALVLIIAAFPATPTYAASHTESGDAGDTLTSAQDISGIAVTEITGEITVSDFYPPYYVGHWDLDFYKIYINDPEAFSATTLNAYTSFQGSNTRGNDTMLFLLDENGSAICMNDNTPKPGYILPYYESTIPAFDPSNPGVPRPTSPGIYYLAITGYSRLPYDQYNNPIFESGSNIEVLGPSFGTGPVSHWSPPIPWYPGYFNFGDYKIILTGVGPINEPPTADANGPYSGDEGSPVVFDSTGSNDLDGYIDLWDWDFGDTGSGSGSTPSHTYLEDGAYTVTLTVTDNDGASDIVTTTATILNVAPVVDAGPDILDVPEGTLFRLLGSDFDDPGVLDTHTIEWDFGDGTSEVGEMAPDHSYGDNGVYTATLTVTDDEGGFGSDTRTITVSNVAPVVEAGPDLTVNEGTLLPLAGSFKDPGWLDTHTIEWDFGDGSPPTSGSLTPSHTYMDDGIYSVTLTITDDDGGVGVDTLTVTVLDLGPKADFSWSPEPQSEGSTLDFTDTSKSYPDTIISWEWDFAGLGTSSEQNPSFTFVDDGGHDVILTVTDEDGSTNTIMHTVTIFDLAPSAEFTWSPEPQGEGYAVSFFDGSTSYPDDIVSWDWDFGGLGTSSSQNPSFTFMDDSSYDVTLTVTDDDGSMDTVMYTVTVINVAPVVSDGLDQNIYYGEPAYLTATFFDPGEYDNPWSWVIDWGDGTSDTGTTDSQSDPITGSHLYQDPDEYHATITVTDKDGDWGEYNLNISVKVLRIDIDIKPGSWPNSINLNGNGVVPVGVFGNLDFPEFNVHDIETSTVLFGLTGFEAVPVHKGYCGHVEELNDDGIDDMVFHFREGELGIPVDTEGNAELTLFITGQLNNGIYFEGTDIIRITPNDDNSRGKGGKGPK
jgi:PKD repeat protein